MPTRDKRLFLLGLPALWLLVALVAFAPGVDGVYLLAVAPAAWLFLFEDPAALTAAQMQLAGLPGILLTGLLLLKLGAKPSTMAFAAAAIALVVWLPLVATLGRTVALTAPRSALLWLLCCFNFALFLLPIPTVCIKLAGRIRRTQSRQTVARNS